MPDQKVNLCNPDSISTYLNGFIRNTDQPDILSEYLMLALEKPLRKDLRYMEELQHLPDNAAEWLSKQWGQCAFHRFQPTPSLNEKISHVYDWIKASVERGASWLQNVDEHGRPLKLLKIGSVEQAIAETEKQRRIEHARLSESVEVDTAFQYEIEHQDIEVLMELESGFKFVKILNTVAAAREAYLMRHCLSDGGYDDFFNGKYPDTSIVSLRDHKNEPHVTLEIKETSKSRRVIQCSGKQNQPPVPKYRDMVLQLLEAREIDYRDQTLWPGFVLHQGVLHPLSRLPDDFTLGERLDIRNLTDFECPKNLHIQGDLILDALQRPFLKPCVKVSRDIGECVQLPCGQRYKIFWHKKDFGNIRTINWRNNDHQLDREDGPALIGYAPDNKTVILERWYKNGELHREGGPAVQSWDSVTRKKISESWYEEGQYKKATQN